MSGLGALVTFPTVVVTEILTGRPEMSAGTATVGTIPMDPLDRAHEELTVVEVVFAPGMV